MATAINGLDAWRNAVSGERWGHKPGAFDGVAYPVSHRPKFQIDARSSFFCIGSCFARNVEEHLIYHGAKVLSRQIVSPREEWDARPNGIVNKFTTDSMLNEIRWLDEPRQPNDRTLFCETSDGWLDLQLTPGAKPVTLERATARRAYLTDQYFARLRKADILIITLGLNELWRDSASGLYLNATPPLRAVKSDPDRYTFHVTDVQQNVIALRALLKRVRTANPNIRTIITVSPVPLGATFTDKDPLVANARSKAVLRAAAETISTEDTEVDYFPSFEMVTHAPRAIAYASDCLHVTDPSVRQVIDKFVRSYIGNSESRAPVGFTELGYLAANPDVEELIRRGEMSSGFKHWQTQGRLERRSLTPDEPTPLMLAAGVTATKKRSFFHRLLSRR